MSKARVDLPEPLTPVTTVSAFSGISMSIFLRLFCFAPRIWMAFIRDLSQPVSFDEYAAEARAVDQIERLALVGKQLQGCRLGMGDDLSRLVEGQFGLPEERGGQIHRKSEPS